MKQYTNKMKRTVGRTDERTDGRTDGRTDKQTDRLWCIDSDAYEPTVHKHRCAQPGKWLKKYGALVYVFTPVEASEVWAKIPQYVGIAFVVWLTTTH